MKECHCGVKMDAISSIKSASFSEYILECAYRLLFSTSTSIRTGNGILIDRKTARLILSNGIRINRNAFNLIVSEMERNGLVKNGNHGIYIRDRKKVIPENSS